MKILYHHRIKSRDGQYIHIKSMINAFRRAGHPVEEVGLTAKDEYSLGEESRFWKRFTDLVPAFFMELLEYAYSFPGALWLWSKILRNRPNFLYERYALGNFAGLLAAKWSGLPLFLEVNSPLAQEKLETGHLRFPQLARKSELCLLRRATKILVVSKALKEIYVQEGIPPENLEVIPNGIDPEKFHNVDGTAVRAKYGLGDSVVVGFVGFFRKWHRLDLILELMAKPLSDLDIKLLLVGNGPARPELERTVEALNLKDRVIWTGTVSHEGVPEILAAVDVALQSEVTIYASPLKLFEYMAAGKAIMAPRRPNILEIVEDDVTALLFEPGNLEEMGSVLRRLALDAGLRMRLGDLARDRLTRGCFTWDVNARRVLDLYEKG